MDGHWPFSKFQQLLQFGDTNILTSIFLSNANISCNPDECSQQFNKTRYAHFIFGSNLTFINPSSYILTKSREGNKILNVHVMHHIFGCLAFIHERI